MDKPRITAFQLASITDSVPSRLKRKLDKNPIAAKDWGWKCEAESCTIHTGKERVTLTPIDQVLSREEQITCSCLLSPRCFHILAVVSMLEVTLEEEKEIFSEEAQEPNIESTTEEHFESQTGSDSTNTPSHSSCLTMTKEQNLAGEMLWKAGAELLSGGARSAGSIKQAHLLRAIHEARAVGLYRLSNGGLRVIEALRQLRSHSDAFDRRQYLSDMTEAMMIAWQTSQNMGSLPIEQIGVARRKYLPIEGRKLAGLLTEPVLTNSGYSGVVTYLIDEAGEISSLNNIRPGTGTRIPAAWKTGVEMGNLSITHQELNRRSLLIQTGTRSADGRLGSGKKVKAVSTTSAGWNETAIQNAFQIPWKSQIERIFQWSSQDALARPASWNFVFFPGRVLGYTGEWLIMSHTEANQMLQLKIPFEGKHVCWRDNLTMLARVPDLRIQVVGRLEWNEPGTLTPLAIGIPDETASAEASSAGEPSSLRLPEKFHSKLNLGLEALKRNHFAKAERKPVYCSDEMMDSESDGLDPLERIVLSVLMGGRHAIPSGRRSSVMQEARLLASQMQPTASELLIGLVQQSQNHSTDLMGVRFPADSTALAERWLAAAWGLMQMRQFRNATMWQGTFESE